MCNVARTKGADRHGGIPHAFWNASDTPALVIELITSAGFEGSFAEMAALFDAAGDSVPDPERAAAVCAKVGLSLDLGSIPALMQAHDLAFWRRV